MADILWQAWQVRHVERRHGVTARQFEEAWDDPGREELAQEDHPEWGPYFRSVGSTADGDVVELVWRWQHRDEGAAVWPITAWFRRPPRRARRARGRRRR